MPAFAGKTATRCDSFNLDCKVNLTTFCPFNAADYLDDEETIAEYIAAALEDPNPDVLLAAVRDVARVRGMARLAKDAGLGRESLYKALTPGAKPRYDTMPCLNYCMHWASSCRLLHVRPNDVNCRWARPDVYL